MLFILDSEERRRAAIAYIAALPLSPLPSIEIKPYKRIRSTAQNRLYWMWLNTIGDWCGYEPESLHIDLRERLLGYQEIVVHGEKAHALISTTELNVHQMTHYLNAIVQLANWLEIPLVYPDDYGYCMGYPNNNIRSK